MQEEERALRPELLRKVMENALERARQVEANNGHHLKPSKHNVNIFPNYNLHFHKRQR